MLRFVFFLFFVLLGIKAAAQQPWYHQLTIADGLPSNTIYWIFQDSKDFLWLGTDNGLTRYDGSEFKVYEHPDMRDFEFTGIHEDAEGSIWAHNFDNQVVSVTGDSVRVFEHDFYTQQGVYMLFAMDEKGDMYIRSKHKIGRYFPELDSVADVDKIPEGATFCLNYYYKDSLLQKEYISILRNLNKPLYDIFVQTEKPPRLNFYNFRDDEAIVVDIEDNPQLILTVKGDELSVFDSLSRYGLEEKVRLNATRVIADELWYCTTGGLVNQQAKKVFLPDVNVSCILQDKAGHTWVSSLKDGLFFIPNFEVNTYTSENANFPLKKLTAITLDEVGNAFIGSNLGQLIHWDTRKNALIREYDIGVSASIRDMVYSEKYGFIWANGLQFRKDKSLPEQDLNFRAIKQLFETNDGDLLIRVNREILMLFSQDDVNRLSKTPFSEDWVKAKKRKTQYWINGSSYPDSPFNTIFYETQKDRIWLGLSQKTMLNTRAGVEEIRLDNAPLVSTAFAESPQGKMWLATPNGGFVILKNDTIQVDKRAAYQEFGAIKKINTEGSKVWMLTRNALLVSDFEGELEWVYNASDGIPIGDITDIAVWENIAYLCTQNGLMSIKHSRKTKPIAPTPIVKSVFINGEKLANYDEQALHHTQNTMRINFTTQALNPIQKFNYEYWLKGAETGWQTTDNNAEFVRYLNLAPGNYTFQLRTANLNGHKSNIVNFDFNIRRPIWQNAWFILLIISSLGAATYFYYRRYIKRLQRQNYYLQQIRASQLTALKTQMNPHFIFNSLNSIQDFIGMNEKRLANEYLGKFSRLMRVYLNHSTRDWIPLEEELDALKIYLELEQLRFEDIKIDLQIAPELTSEDIALPPLFIQPYIENAFKHGLLHKKGTKVLHIHFTKTSSKNLQITIEDNGIGRANAKKIKNQQATTNPSFATTANQKRLQLINYNNQSPIAVSIIDLFHKKVPTGTKILINIPINID